MTFADFQSFLIFLVGISSFLILHSKGARNYTTMPLSSSSPLRRPQSSAFVDLNGDLTAGIFYNTYILNIEV